jgi:acyl-CoA dehydrogenase
MVVRVIDKAIQIHGGAGVSQDTPLARLFISTRFLRIGDGPDEVHRRAIAREELRKYNP